MCNISVMRKKRYKTAFYITLGVLAFAGMILWLCLNKDTVLDHLPDPDIIPLIEP